MLIDYKVTNKFLNIEMTIQAECLEDVEHILKTQYKEIYYGCIVTGENQFMMVAREIEDEDGGIVKRIRKIAENSLQFNDTMV